MKLLKQHFKFPTRLWLALSLTCFSILLGVMGFFFFEALVYGGPFMAGIYIIWLLVLSLVLGGLISAAVIIFKTAIGKVK